jgi:hypothetical protein
MQATTTAKNDAQPKSSTGCKSRGPIIGQVVHGDALPATAAALPVELRHLRVGGENVEESAVIALLRTACGIARTDPSTSGAERGCARSRFNVAEDGDDTAKTTPPEVDQKGGTGGAEDIAAAEEDETRVTVMTMIEITSSVADTRAETRTLVMVRKIAPAKAADRE